MTMKWLKNIHNKKSQKCLLKISVNRNSASIIERDSCTCVAWLLKQNILNPKFIHLTFFNIPIAMLAPKTYLLDIILGGVFKNFHNVPQVQISNLIIVFAFTTKTDPY